MEPQGPAPSSEFCSERARISSQAAGWDRPPAPVQWRFGKDLSPFNTQVLMQITDAPRKQGAGRACQAPGLSITTNLCAACTWAVISPSNRRPSCGATTSPTDHAPGFIKSPLGYPPRVSNH